MSTRDKELRPVFEITDDIADALDEFEIRHLEHRYTDIEDVLDELRELSVNLRQHKIAPVIPAYTPQALEVYPGNELTRQVKVKYRSKVKQQIFLALMEKADMTDRAVCEWLDQHWEYDLPYGKPFARAYEGDERPLLETAISKVRADVRRLRLITS